jgi:hypothetical protein
MAKEAERLLADTGWLPFGDAVASFILKRLLTFCGP